MPKNNRILLVGAVIAVAGVGLFSQARAQTKDAPQVLASVPVPVEPYSLAWSADGRYLAAGTWGRAGAEVQQGHNNSEVYVIDVAKASVVATLKTADWVESLAFSPEGKWLAVGCRDYSTVEARAGRAELTVFSVPKFTAVNTFKGTRGYGFVDLAWSADGRSLYAIDGPVHHGQGSPQIRHWSAPTFTEDAQPAITVKQKTAYDALAVSPDGRTLAVAERIENGLRRMVRLFELGNGAERLSFKTVDEDITWTRLGFTPDGRAVGVLDRYKLEWWDVTTGMQTEPGWDVLKERPAKPSVARLARQPAGLSEGFYSVSTDDGWRARGEERHRGLGDLGFDNREKEFGAFVFLTERATAKTRTWRVSKTAQHWPVVAFSPDGRTLACSAGETVGGAVRIMAVPK